MLRGLHAYRRAVLARLDRIIDLLARTLQQEEAMAIDLTDLAAEVAATKGAAQSAGVLINGLADKIDELIAGSNDPALQAQLTELKDALATSRVELEAAVAANPVP